MEAVQETQAKQRFCAFICKKISINIYIFFTKLIWQHSSNCLSAQAPCNAASCVGAVQASVAVFSIRLLQQTEKTKCHSVHVDPCWGLSLSRSTDLMFPQQNGHKASVDAALDYEDHVGGFRRLRHRQIFVCREFIGSCSHWIKYLPCSQHASVTYDMSWNTFTSAESFGFS